MSQNRVQSSELSSDFQLKGDDTNLFIADFNGDGKSDILSQKKKVRSTDQVLLSEGNGQFATPITLPGSFARTGDNTNLYIGDFNGDGRSDVLRQKNGSWGESYYTDTIYSSWLEDRVASMTAQVLLSQGDGFNSITLDENFVLNGNVTNLYIADFNGDGKSDILHQEKGTAPAKILFSRGEGDFGFTPITLHENFHLNGDWTNLHIGDFNGDGRSDILRQEFGSADDDDHTTAQVFLSPDDGNLNSITPITLHEHFFLKGDWTNLHIGDFNGDGRSDLLRQEYGSADDDAYMTAQVFLSPDDGNFNSITPITLPESFALKGDDTNLHVADLDGDGFDEILVQQKHSTFQHTSRVLSWNHEQNFIKHVLPNELQIDGKSKQLYIADYNGDGQNNEILVQDSKNDSALLYSLGIKFSDNAALTDITDLPVALNIGTHGYGIATDSIGNVWATGSFSGSIDIDLDGTIDLTSNGATDSYVAKFSRNGDLLNAFQIGGGSHGPDRGFGIATDSIGDVWVTGDFWGSIDIDGDGNDDLTSDGGSDSYVAKFSSNGDFVNAYSIGSNRDDEEGRSIATDNMGNAWATGTFQTSDGGTEGYVAKFDYQGNLVKFKKIGGSGEDYGHGIATDSEGNVWATGSFQGSIDIDLDLDGTIDLTSNGGRDSYVAKFDSEANLVFAKNIGGSGYDLGRGIATDSNGNAWAIGSFEGKIDIDGDGINDLTSNGGNDSYVAKFDSEGNLVKAFQIGGSSNDWGSGIATDSNGNVWATGYFEGKIDIDGDGNNDLTSNGGIDSYVAKFDSEGNLVKAKNLGGSSGDWGFDIATDSNGNAWATGALRGSIDIDGDGNNDLTRGGYVVKFYTHPTDLELSNNSIDENVAANTVVGTFSTTDPDTGDSFTYQLVPGAGDTDNAAFTIVEDQLLINSSPDFETQSSYSIRVQTTDAGGESYSENLTININYVNYVNEGPSLPVALNIGTHGYGIATDSNGNVWATGSFSRSIDIDLDGTIDLTSNGLDDSYVAKFSRNGDLLNAFQIGSSGNERGWGIATDSNDDVWVTGSFSGSIDINGDDKDDLTSDGGSDSYVAKFSSNGDFVNAYSIGSNRDDEEGRSIATDNMGNAWATGTFHTSHGGSEGYVAKFDYQGNLVKFKKIGGSGVDYGHGIATDSEGNLWATGSFQGSIDIDLDLDGTIDLTSNGGTDSYVAKFDSEANLVFAKNIGGSNFDVGYGIATDSNGDAWATGSFSGSIDIDGDGINDLTSNGGIDSYVAKFDSEGNLVKAKNIGGSSTDWGRGIATDSNDNAWATGRFFGSIDLDLDGINDLTSNGGTDSYVAKFDSEGNLVKAKNIGGSSNDQGFGIATDSNGNVWATGALGGSADIDGDGNNDLTGGGYVVKFFDNAAPTDLSLSNNSIDENVAANTVVGTFSTTDPDTGDSFTYQLVAGAGDTDNAAFTIVEDQLLINSSPDFEAQSSYSILVQTTDAGGESYSTHLTININDVNEVPTDLSLSNNSIDENVAPNTVVGTFSTTDPDTGDSFTYQLVAGAGDTDNAAFTIVEDQLLINSSPDFETQSSYSIRVQSTDAEGESYSENLTININNVNEVPININDVWQPSVALKIGGSNIESVHTDIATDSNDNVWATGSFSGSIDIDLDGNNDLTSNGGSDSYVAKFDSEGNLVFAYNIGGSSRDYGYGIATDSNDNVWATGSFQGSIDIDGDDNDDLTSNGGSDSYVAKFNSNGDLVKALKIGGSGYDLGRGIATDSNGNAWAIGYFSGKIDIDLDGNNDLTSNGGSDSYVAKFNSNGDFVQALKIGGSGWDEGSGIATDSNGNAWATGTFEGKIDIDLDGNNELTSNGGTDSYVAKFNSNGDFVQAYNIGGSGNDWGYDITTDSNGNVWATGSFSGSIDIDGDGNNDLTSNGFSDSYVAKFDSNGDLVKALNIGGSYHTSDGYGITTDSNGNVWATGTFEGSIDIDGDGNNELTSNGSLDGYVAKFDSNGDLVQALKIGSSDTDLGLGIATDSNDNVWTTGSLGGSIDIDGDGNYELIGNDGSYVIKFSEATNAAQLKITPSEPVKAVEPNTSVSFDVNYSTEPAETPTTGIAFGMHWDSSQVAFDPVTGLTEHFSLGAQPISAVLDDPIINGGLDGDPNTDKYILQAWVDAEGNWPNNPNPTLYTANFTALPGFEGTQINFSANPDDLPANSNFVSSSIALTLRTQPTLDIDGNGAIDALTDGLVAIRYLFGFRGETLTKDVLGEGATSDPSEIVTYLDEVGDMMLDIDGNGTAGALTDGILFLRHALGFEDQALIQGVISEGATRTTAEAINEHMQSFLGVVSEDTTLTTVPGINDQMQSFDVL